MIRAIIIDDETNCVETLSILLKMHCPEVTVLQTCNSGEEGLKAIAEHNPDLVFLDIEMPRMNGFEMLKKLEQICFQVIFTTAYSQFAIKAFKFGALDYLLKPIDPTDLQAAIARVKSMSNKGSIKEQLEVVLQSLQPEAKTQRIALSTGDGMIFVNTDEIMYCQADSNYTHVKLVKGEKHLLAKSLKEFEDVLAGKKFYRIHNSFLINLDQIKKFVRGDGGYIIMNDGAEITIARSRREEFFALFDKF